MGMGAGPGSIPHLIMASGRIISGICSDTLPTRER